MRSVSPAEMVTYWLSRQKPSSPRRGTPRRESHALFQVARPCSGVLWRNLESLRSYRSSLFALRISAKRARKPGRVTALPLHAREKRIRIAHGARRDAARRKRKTVDGEAVERVLAGRMPIA
jgi:hypothetical protein